MHSRSSSRRGGRRHGIGHGVRSHLAAGLLLGTRGGCCVGMPGAMRHGHAVIGDWRDGRGGRERVCHGRAVEGR